MDKVLIFHWDKIFSGISGRTAAAGNPHASLQRFVNLLFSILGVKRKTFFIEKLISNGFELLKCFICVHTWMLP